MSQKISNCVVCNSSDWLQLPVSSNKRSVRSDGFIMLEPINKLQCKNCGLVQINTMPNVQGLQDLYTHDYNIYDFRPESEKFVAGRYKALSQAITNSILPHKPEFVLEVGCGNGSALQAVQSIWKEAKCIGLEPVTTAVSAAQKNGIEVYQGIIGGELPEEVTKHKYDVIYSIHVIEHTQNPVEFLNNIKPLLKPSGYVIITCPNSLTPNLEIMRTDHNFSMTPYHLEEIARKAEFTPLRNTLCPGGGEDLDYEYNQLLVCLNKPSSIESKPKNLPSYLSDLARANLFDARKKYFENFDNLDSEIQKRMGEVSEWYCFGSGGWACILAGYAPNVWKKIKGCVIDGGSDQIFYGKKIYAYEEIKNKKGVGIIVGTNPAIQTLIEQRLQADRVGSTICWNDIIFA